MVKPRKNTPDWMFEKLVKLQQKGLTEKETRLFTMLKTDSERFCLLNVIVRSDSQMAFPVLRTLVEQSGMKDRFVGYFEGRTLLMHAVAGKNPQAPEIARYLIEECGINVNAKGSFDDSAILYAVENDNPRVVSIVDVLLEHGSTLEPCGVDSKTPLANLELSDSPHILEIAKKLVEAGVDILHKNVYGQNALFNIAGSDNPQVFDVIRYLVECETKLLCTNGRSERDVMSDIVNESDNERNGGQTIMTQVVENGNPRTIEILNYLIECGANVHKRTLKGKTALYYAMTERNEELIDFFLSMKEFSLTDLMPMHKHLIGRDYPGVCKRAVSRIISSIDSSGIEYARKVMKDVREILKKTPNPDSDTCKALKPLVKRLVPMDWANDAQVTSNDFMGCDVER